MSWVLFCVERDRATEERERERLRKEREPQRKREIASTEKREERAYWSERCASVRKKKNLDCFTKIEP